MPITLRRVYEKPTREDGYRVLVDRLWPRGISKEKAALDEWLKEVAPTTELRKWFHSDPSRWEEFRSRYLSELASHRETLRPLARRAASERVTLLFSSREEEHNHAVILKRYLEGLATAD